LEELPTIGVLGKPWSRYMREAGFPAVKDELDNIRKETKDDQRKGCKDKSAESHAGLTESIGVRNLAFPREEWLESYQLWKRIDLL
jgi:hypothetical protein